MSNIIKNPHALYIHCDGAMDYSSKNKGGVGIHIKFPDFIELDDRNITIGSYEGANIERIELEAIYQGMQEVLSLFKIEYERLKNLDTIIFLTDRCGLNDKEKTSPFRIREWRKNKWRNHEGKPIKNSDLLEKIDKSRQKINKETHCSVSIEYIRRKYNKDADKLAKEGKAQPLVRNNIDVKGVKIGKRKFDGITLDLKLIELKQELHVHIFKKEPVKNQWEISVEICEGIHHGKKFNIYTDVLLEKKLKRRNEYFIRIKRIHKYHVEIYRIVKRISK